MPAGGRTLQHIAGHSSKTIRSVIRMDRCYTAEGEAVGGNKRFGTSPEHLNAVVESFTVPGDGPQHVSTPLNPIIPHNFAAYASRTLNQHAIASVPPPGPAHHFWYISLLRSPCVVLRVTRRSHSCCDSIRYLSN